MWFRVELNKDGGVAKAEPVEAALANGRFVYFVEADTKEGAIVNAVRRYEAYKKRQRDSKRMARETNIAKGGCSECGMPTNGTRRCVACNERANNIRYGAEPKGKQGVVTPRVQELRVARAHTSQRAAILSEILEAALSMRAGVAFISWLRNQRDDALAGKAAAAE